MAKRPAHKQQDVIRKDGGQAFAIDDDEIGLDAASEQTTESATETIGADETVLWAYDHLAVDSEGKPRIPVPQDTPLQAASIVLPRAVLIALLDPAHELADAETATGLGLLQDGAVTAIGGLVIAGTDRTALGHKMAAKWRERHNTALDGKT